MADSTVSDANTPRWMVADMRYLIGHPSQTRVDTFFLIRLQASFGSPIELSQRVESLGIVREGTEET